MRHTAYIAVLVAAAALGVTAHAQTTGNEPEFSSATLDLATGNLTISFDRSIDLTELDFAKLHIRDQGHSTGGISLQPYNDTMRPGQVSYPSSRSDGLTNGFGDPEGITINGTHVFVADTTNDRIQIFHLNKTHIKNIGTGDLDRPQSVAVNATGYIFVADINNNRIQIFDPNGTHADTIRVRDGSINGRPNGVALDSNGRIIVSITHNVFIFDPNGTLVDRIGRSDGRQNDANEGLKDTEDVAVDSNDRIIVPQNEGRRVGIFGPDTEHIHTITFSHIRDRPHGVVIDSNDRIFIADAGSNNPRVSIFTPGGDKSVESIPIGSSGGSTDAALDSAGRLWVTREIVNRVDIFNPLSSDIHLVLDSDALRAIGMMDAPVLDIETAAVRTAGSDVIAASIDNTLVLLDEKKPGLELAKLYNTTGELSIYLDERVNPFRTDPAKLHIREQGQSEGGVMLSTSPVRLDAYDFDSSLAINAPKQPSDIAIASDGDIIIADSENHCVRIFHENGTRQKIIGQNDSCAPMNNNDGTGEFDFPRAVAISSDDFIFVADTSNHRIQVLNPAGTDVVSEFGSEGNGTRQFQSPQGIAFTGGGNILVADTGNNRIQVYRNDFQPPIGSEGTGPGEFMAPTGVAVDSTDRIIIADRGNHRVQILDRSGAHIHSINATDGAGNPMAGTGPGEFMAPTGVDVGPNDMIVVTERDGNRVQVFDRDGAYITEFNSAGIGGERFDGPRGAAFDGADILVADTDNNLVHRFVPGMGGSTHVIDDVTPHLLTSIGRFGTSDGQFMQPSDVAIHGNRIYVADSANHRIQIFDPDGSLVKTLGRTDTAGSPIAGNLTGAFDFPRGMAVNGSGHVFVSDTNNHRIEIFDPDGIHVNSLNYTQNGRLTGDDQRGSFNTPHGITINGSDHVFVADRNNHRIQILDRGGAYVGEIGGIDVFNRPEYVAQGAGMIAVADTRNHTIQIFDSSDHSHIRTLGSEGESKGQFKGPRGVTIDSTGRIWVSDTENHRVQVFNPDGTHVHTFGSEGSGKTQLREPRGILIDRDGHAWVADSGNHRVQEFAFASDGLVFNLTSRALGVVNDMGNRELDIDEAAMTDTAGNAIEQSHDNAITTDTTAPVIDAAGIRFVPASGTIGYGGQLNITFRSDETLSIHPDSAINDRLIKNDTLSYDSDTGNYTITYTVSRGEPDVADSDPLPVSIILYDTARNPGGAITGILAGDAPGISGSKAAVTLDYAFDGRSVIRLNFSEPVNAPELVSQLQVKNRLGETVISLSPGNATLSERYDNYRFGDKIGRANNLFGSGELQFTDPFGIAVNGTDYIFVADTSNHRIQILNPERGFEKFIGGTRGNASGQFDNPYDIDVNGTGHIFVADRNNHRIQIFSPGGDPLDSIGKLDSNGDPVTGSENGTFNRPDGITINGTGHIFVADSKNHRIQIFSPDGTYADQFGTSGTGDGQFDDPHGIAINGTGHIFVSDTDNDRIQIFGPDGTYADQFGSRGDGRGELESPYGITFDRTGRLIVADGDNDRIQIFDPAGAHIGMINTVDDPTGAKTFQIPTDVAVDSADNILVVDTLHRRIVILEPYPYLSEFTLTLADAAVAKLQGAKGLYVDVDADYITAASGIHPAASHALPIEISAPRSGPDPADPDPVRPLVRSGGGGGGGGGSGGGGGGGSAVSPVLVIYDVCGENPRARAVVSTHGLTTSAQLTTLSSIYEGVQVDVDPGRYVTNVVDADVRVFDFELDSTDSYAPFSIVLSGGGGSGVSSPISADQCAGYAPLSDVPGIELVRPVDADLTHDGLRPAASGTPGTDAAVSEFSYEGTMYAISHDPHITIIHMDVQPDSKSITFTLAEPVSGAITLDLPEDLIRGMMMVTIQDEQLDATFNGGMVQVDLPEGTTQFTLVASYVVPEFGVITLLILGASIAMAASMRRYLPLVSNRTL